MKKWILHVAAVTLLVLSTTPACTPAQAKITNYGGGTSGGGTPVGWMEESAAIALNVSSTLTRRFGGDTLSAPEAVMSGPATINTAHTGVAYNLPGTAGTANCYVVGTSLLLIAHPITEPWYVRAKVWVTASTFTAAKFISPIGLGNATDSIYTLSIPATSTTVWQTSFFYGAADHVTSGGSVGTHGSTTSPTNAWAYYSIEHDGKGNVTFKFNGTSGVVDTTHLILTSGNPYWVVAFSSDLAAGVIIDSIFVATVPE